MDLVQLKTDITISLRVQSSPNSLEEETEYLNHFTLNKIHYNNNNTNVTKIFMDFRQKHIYIDRPTPVIFVSVQQYVYYKLSNWTASV